MMSGLDIILCFFCLKGINTETYTQENTLLVVRAGTNTSVRDVWETAGGLNDAAGAGHQHNIYKRLFDDKNFRSIIVDSWNETNYPDNVLVAIHNKYGDELCSMDFETPNTNWTFDSWLKEYTLSGWSYMQPTDAKFQTGRPFFDLYVSDNIDDDKAWIAVADSSSVSFTDHTPMFLCSTGQPHTLMKETIVTVPPVTLTGKGCYPWYNTAYTLAFTDSTSMTVEICITECISRGTVYAFLESGSKCNCGDITGSSVDLPGQCGGGCTGDSAQVCGTTDGFFNAYATGGAGTQTTNAPTSGSSNVSYVGVPGPTMSTVHLTSVIKTILAGDLNTTVELTSFTSGSRIYIRAVELLYKDNSNTLVTSTYSVWYQLHPERTDILAKTFDQLNYPQFYPTDGARVDLDVLPAWNLTFVFSSSPVDGQAVINIYTIGDDEFVTGYFLSIMSFKSIVSLEIIPQTKPKHHHIPLECQHRVLPYQDVTTTTTHETTSTTETSTTAVETTAIEKNTSGSTTSTQDTPMSTIDTGKTASEEISTATHLDETTTAISTTNSVGTAASLSTTDQTPSVCLCTCVTSNFNLTAEQLEQTIQDLKKSLSVSKTELSSYKRKLISAPDGRKSAASIGCVGLLVIGFVFGSVIFCDGISLYYILWNK